MSKQKMTIENLAVMVKRGFDDVTRRMATKEDLAELRKEFFEVHKHFDERLRLIEDDVHDIKVALGPLVHMVAAMDTEIKNLNLRVNRLERKAGLAK